MKYFCKLSFALIVCGLLLGCATHLQRMGPGHAGRKRIKAPTNSKHGRNFYGKELCQAKGFHCIRVYANDTWAKLFPNKKERDMVKRLNRLNMPVRYRDWIVVPDNLADITYNNISPFPLKMKATGKKQLIIRLHEHAFAAYDPQGTLVHWGPISGGKGWCKDTNEDCSTAVGEFTIYRRQGASCTSSKYPIETNGGAPMPYCMHYYRGWAIHGSTLPGFHNSHGCVRLFHEDAKWLNEFFAKIGTRVLVENGTKPTVPILSQRRGKLADS